MSADILPDIWRKEADHRERMWCDAETEDLRRCADQLETMLNNRMYETDRKTGGITPGLAWYEDQEAGCLRCKVRTREATTEASRQWALEHECEE